MILSMKTVQAYCARIKEKLGLANISELVRAAVRWVETKQNS
jgi:DNA-binding CsgD family transcriptional regulator